MRRNKLFYTPGLITLLGLPIFLIFMGPDDADSVRMPVRATLRIPSEGPSASNSINFTEKNILQEIRHKQIIEVELDENHYKNYQTPYEDKFHWIAHEVQRIRYSRDTNTVLKLYFTRQSTFGDFVWLCELMKVLGVKRYTYFNDCFYVLPNPIEPIRPVSQTDSEDVYYHYPIRMPAIRYQTPSLWGILRSGMRHEIRQFLGSDD